MSQGEGQNHPGLSFLGKSVPRLLPRWSLLVGLNTFCLLTLNSHLHTDTSVETGEYYLIGLVLPLLFSLYRGSNTMTVPRSWVATSRVSRPARKSWSAGSTGTWDHNQQVHHSPW